MTTHIALGAEAQITSTEVLGRPAITKARLAKPYRHPALDQQLRTARTREEAKALQRARSAGVPVPVVFDVDEAASVLLLERLAGVPLRDVLRQEDDTNAGPVFFRLGRDVARLHEAGLTHGDLTTSNVIVDGERMWLIDFGLAQATPDDEQAAVDLHVLEEALQATDRRHEDLFAAFLEGYESGRDATAVLRRLEGVRQRGRYRGH